MTHELLQGHAENHQSRAAIAGHPIHPMLVPLPIGALTGAFASDVAYLATGDAFWARASRLLLGAGLVTGVAAAPFGMADLALVPHARTPMVGWLHGAGIAVVMGLTAINLATRAGDTTSVPRTGAVLSALGGALLGVSGWFGGELAYRHRVGVAAFDPDADD